jgi:hypothetical protein
MCCKIKYLKVYINGFMSKNSNCSKIDDIQGSRLQINRAAHVNFLGLPLSAPWTWALGLLVQLVGFVYKLSNRNF